MPTLDLSKAKPAAAVAPPAEAPRPLPAKRSLVGLDRAEIAEALAAIGIEPKEMRMRVGQVWLWLYQKGAKSFSEMSNVSKTLRTALEENYTLDRPEVVVEQVSADGTRKWLIRIPPSVAGEKWHEIETVYIPTRDRGTLCISSQVGCTLTCSFCHTGTQKLVRNLTSAEIVAQIVVARDQLGDWPGQSAPEGAFVPKDGGRFVSNIVLMGMGEPLYNVDNVVQGIRVLLDQDGLQLSKRRITLSTSGVVPEIERVGHETGVSLAISLHAVRDDLRDELVPINKKYGIAELLDACRHYPAASNARRITFEYVMLKGVNDSIDDARRLVRLLKGIPAKINLIPFNPWPGTQYECSDWEQIEKFSEVVFEAGYSSPVRTPRGRDILAACGQLKSETERLRAKDRAELMSKSEQDAFRAMAFVD